MSDVQTITPAIGMGATAGYGSDCYPYTIVKVSLDGKVVTVQADRYTPAPDHKYPENQSYIYTPDPMGAYRTFTLRKNGHWVQTGEPMKGGPTLHIGHRRFYYDPSF